MNSPSHAILDDDPTGAQSVCGVPVLTEWDPTTVRGVLDEGPAGVHLLTNSRACTAQRAYDTVLAAARSADRAGARWPAVLRGDSTLRGHLLPEYKAVRAVCFPDQTPVLLLAPALPAAGRITVDGCHLVGYDGERRPVATTDYARDRLFGYTTSRLLEWAEERFDGYFAARNGDELHLEQSAYGGDDAVAAMIAQAGRGDGPRVVVPDATSDSDVRLIAEGYRQAVTAGAAVVVRCAPTFVGALCRSEATSFANPPQGAGPVLVICGSYVPLSTAQLATLAAAHPGCLIEADPSLLVGPGGSYARESSPRSRAPGWPTEASR
ncbi:MAG: four-carbon acid sugar kinase family protein [Dehalococcoidia bacterium]